MSTLLLKKILIVDDNEINRELLKDIFTGQYEILEAGDGEEAIQLIDEYNEELMIIFLDMIMPKKNGLEVLRFMNEKDYIQYIPVMMITGEATPEIEETAYTYGVSDIVYKPFHARIVQKRTQNVVQLFQNKLHLENKLMARSRELQKSRRKLQKNTEFLINALSSVLEFRNRESEDHTSRVKYMTGKLLECYCETYPDCGLTKEDVKEITRASTLHEIGKIAIPDAIILKKGTLSEEEYEVIKRHPIDGCKILENFKQEENEFYRYCYDICHSHHERYDGSGYPEGLKGEDIPLCAQIVGLADEVEAACGSRIYKQDVNFEEAFEKILEEKGRFSSQLLRCLEKCRETIHDMFLFGIPEE